MAGRLRFGQVACRMLAADHLSGAGIAAGSTITSAPRVHHMRRPTQGPHHASHDRRLAWVAGDGAGGRAWLTWVQVLSALCQVVAWRGEGLVGGCPAMVEQLALGFGGLLRRLRAEAGLTQEELAEAAGLSPRSVSDLERGIHPTARKDTAELLAGALGLAGPARPLFVAAEIGRASCRERV